MGPEVKNLYSELYSNNNILWYCLLIKLLAISVVVLILDRHLPWASVFSHFEDASYHLNWNCPIWASRGCASGLWHTVLVWTLSLLMTFITFLKHLISGVYSWSGWARWNTMENWDAKAIYGQQVWRMEAEEV